jgi:hypothetical protein
MILLGVHVISFLLSVLFSSPGSSGLSSPLFRLFGFSWVSAWVSDLPGLGCPVALSMNII